MRRARGRSLPVAGTVTVALLATLLLAPGAEGDPVPPPPIPVVVAPQADLVCPNLFGYKDDTLKRKKARAVMAGQVDMGEYGVMTIPLDPTTSTLAPTWRTQSSLDLAGNRYIDSLEWTVPLLRVGLDLGEIAGDVEGAAMVAQFVALLRNWVATQPRPAKRGAWVNHPQYGGFRLGVFVCAARELPDPVDNAWAVAQARDELAVQLAGYSLAGANNTMLNAQLAAYAAAHQVGTAAQQAQARSHVMTLLATLSNSDGSDREGAPGYGRYLATIEARTATVLAQFGDLAGADVARAAIARSADFLVAASRPDRRLETIGDTDYQRIPETLYPADSPAAWVASSGATGRKPTQRFTTWRGGYAFGHSRWVAGDDEQSSFYSVRTGAATSNAAHRHSDTTAVTWYSRGVSWVADPGPYRYDTSTLRSYVRSRRAHSAFVAAVPASFVAPARWVHTRTGQGFERTCLRDPTYETTAARLQLVRCVYYLRDLDALVVQDFVRPTKRKRKVRQQYVLPPEVARAASSGTRVVLEGSTGSGAERTATVTSTRTVEVKKATTTRAVLGRSYAVKEPGRLLRVRWAAPVGLTSTTTTVLADGPTSITSTGSGMRVTVHGRTVDLPMAFTRFPRPRAALTLRAVPGKVRKGRKATLIGTVRAAGRRLPGTAVTLQVRGLGGWQDLATRRTDAKARYAFRVRAGALGSTTYRAKVHAAKGAAGWKRSASASATLVVVKRRHRT